MNDIRFFSGTGNSRLVAGMLGKSIGTLPLTINRSDNAPIAAENLILVFPVYCFDIPPIVGDFLKNAVIPETTKIFALVTCGGEIGNALAHLDKMLRSKGTSLAWGMAVPMADNSLVFRTSESLIAERKESLGSVVEAAAEAMKAGEKMRFPRRVKDGAIEMTLKIAMHGWYRFEKRKVDAKSCTGCGICVKACPVGNVGMQDGKAAIGDSCAWCFGCLNACPRNAISFGRIKPDRRHPRYSGF